MKNTFGQNVSLTLFGESHGAAVGAVLDGIAPGIAVDEERIARELSRRRPSSAMDTPRREKDAFQIVSGVFNGKTTGTPICIVIPNENTKSSDYSYGVARPSHADYSAFCKYHGFEDYRGGGHFSGRITAALVAVGGILLPALENCGITVGTHILRCKNVSDRPFEDASIDILQLKTADFPTLDNEIGEQIKDLILQAGQSQNSVGGVTQTAVCGLPAGLGEPWFDSVEGLLSHALFSLGGVKGVSFGEGFGFADLTGVEANDAFRSVDGRVVTKTNRNGGINGGITNGMPVLFDCAVKPTPTISRPQETVDFIKDTNAEITAHGRHDPAIIRRICPVIDSVTALVLCDFLAGRYGTDFLAKGTNVCVTD
ncbi:MAG: chorismate synthase [Clostridia bacterium]|nr:chorismate synthase [Clostridia bacterium]